MKKLGLGLVIVVIALMVAGTGYALFSATARGGASRLEAGTVAIEVVGEPVNIGNLTPGSMGEALFEIHNTGTLPVVYTVSWETSGGLFEGENPVELGSLRNGRIVPGGVNYIAVTWSFPQSAGNEYQGASGTFELVVTATQDVGAYP